MAIEAGRRRWMTVVLDGSDDTKRARLRLDTNLAFFIFFFLMMVVRLGSSPAATMWRDRRCTTTSLPEPSRTPMRTPLRPSERPPIEARPRDSPWIEVCPVVPLRVDVWLLPDEVLPVWPPLWLAAVPPPAPVPDWPEFCAETGTANANAAVVARANARVLICSSA